MTSSIPQFYDNLFKQPVVQAAMDAAKADDDRAFEEQKALQQIPAPPFHEERRAAYFMKRLKEMGLTDVKQDAEGNVFGFRPGTGGKDAPTLVIDAHLDSVFPEETDLTLTIREDGAICGPGICDDARGVATQLSILHTLQEKNIKTVGNIIFLGSVGEEDLGDLRGLKAFYRDNADRVDGHISIDGVDQGRIVGTCIGCHRYFITFKTPGGHSYARFGTPSAVHAAGRCIAKMAEIRVPDSPKTTFTVGTAKGGTTINSIASECTIGVDLRSVDNDEMAKLEKQMRQAIEEAIAEENKRWGREETTVEIKQVGDRPAGAQPETALICQSAKRCLELIGYTGKIWFGPASTNANVPVSLGIPSLDVGVGGESGGEHTLSEWHKRVNDYLSAQNVMLMAFGLVGIDGVSQPLLEKRVK